ncbi:MAG: S-layer homology domain-containing protein, partial [Anaerovorax sp.]|nr:S-layer homology domain-containing protein [Anaerovorax sp.]
MKLDSSKPITAKTEIALKHKTMDGFSEEIAETLPMDAYFIAFSAKVGDQYCVSAGENYVVTQDDGLFNATHSLENFVAQPKSVNAQLEPLQTSFIISMPKNIEYLKVNSSIKLDIAPSYKVNWSSGNTSVATVDGDGIVKALSAGTATITAECLGVSGTYELKTSVMSNPRSFTLNSDNPDVNVTISDGTFTYNPTSIDNGIFSYLLEDGNYTYVVSKEGFPNKEGSFIVSESGNNNVSVSMYYSVTFNLTAGPGVSSVDSASITVLDSENTTVSGINRKYDNLNGKYSYTVTCDGCYTASGFFDSYGMINVILQKDRSGSKEADWRGTFNHDHGNAVITTMLPISADKVYEKWATMVGSSNYGASYAGTSVIIDDYLYITGNGFLNKINTKTGKIIAQVEAGTTGYIYDYLAYGDGMIFLSGSSYISAYEAETLTLLWRTSVDGQHSTQVNGSLNSKGTINKFRPIIYSNGYIFCGKNAFKTTSFEVDKNGYNMPVWSIDDDFNWNTGVIVGDYYYVAAVQTMYVVNYKTGEIVDSWKFSTDNNVYTWGGVTYSPDTQRLYWASYSGAKFYTIKIDTTTGKFLERFCPSMDRRYTVDVSQESVCTPVVFNGRVYLVGQKGNVDVLNAVPTQKNYVYTLETIYTVETPERTKIQSTPILCTAYATEENSNTIYLYFQGYTRPSPIYVLKDSAEINSAENADIAIVAAPAKSQYAFEQIAVDKKGSLYFFNESGYLFCFEKVDFVTVDSVVALINALPSSKDVTSAAELQIKNARKAYDALTDEQKLEISSQTSKKLTDAESVLANLEKPSPDIDKDITVYFTLLGTEKDGENGTANTLKRGNLTTWIKRQSVTVKSGSTVGDVFSKVLHDNSYRYSGLSGNYIKNITHPSGVTLGEFDNGKLSGWMYTVNGEHPNIALNDYELSNKDEIIWHYTDDYTEEEGSEKWGNKPYNAEEKVDNIVKISIDITAKTDSAGKATATITSKDLKNALDKALEAVKKAEKDGKKNVKPEIHVDVKIDSKASAVETMLQLSSVEELTKAEARLSVNSSIGNIIVENKTLKEVQKAAEGKEVSFQIARIDKNRASAKTLTEAQKKAVGENPVYDVSILSGEKKIKTFGSQKLSILLPYTLKSGENAKQIAAWYLDDQGKLTKLTSKYDEKTKLVTFEINHLSCFVIGSNITTDANNGFNDVKKGQWYYDSITYLVEKGIVSGTTKNTFDPNANITRAEFTQILYGMAKNQAGASGSAITAESVKVDSNEASKIFSDVKNTDWYAKAVAWAYTNGIVKGTKMADNSISFMPNAKITRQDMAVMIQNYIQKVEKKSITETNAGVSFADDTAVAPYAKDAVILMQKGGIISGIKQEDGSYKFAPKANATRAEA